VANQQQRQKGRGQATRKGSGPRDGQQARTGSGTRRGQAARATGRGATAVANGTAKGQARTQSARPATSRQARESARQAATGLAAARSSWTPRWVPVAALVLSLVGLGLGIYLTIAHLKGAQLLACANHGFIDCAAVTTSPESEVFGVFPVAELGLGFFLVMTLLNLPWAWRPTWTWLPGRLTRSRPGLESALPVYAWRVRLAGIIVGILFILYLIYTELITLRQICLFCTYTHITTFLLFVLLVVQAAFWGDPGKAPATAPAKPAAR